MVFKRRDKPPLFSRIRHAIVPRTGWRRALEYLSHRVRRLPDTPHRIAVGLACGVFASFTPFFGLHFIVAALLAKLLRGNLLASVIGTFAGNPLTFPFIASLSLSFGRRILGYGATGRDFSRVTDAFRQFFVGLWQSLASLFGHDDAQWGKLTLFLQDVMWPYFVGGLLPGLAASVATYYLSRPLIAAYQVRRRLRLAKRERKRRAARARAAGAKPESDNKLRRTYKADKPRVIS
jgi:uncharacterized protein (DUF2062 family)